MANLTLRIDDAAYERLRREAFDRRTTITALLRAAVGDYIHGLDLDASGPWPVRKSTNSTNGTSS